MTSKATRTHRKVQNLTADKCSWERSHEQEHRRGGDHLRQEAELAIGQRMLSVREFCRLYSIGRSLAYEEMKSGRLVYCKVGRRRLIRLDDAERWSARTRIALSATNVASGEMTAKILEPFGAVEARRP
jgi:excisionase family DNA binding protein